MSSGQEEEPGHVVFTLHGQQGEKKPEFGELQMEKGRRYRIPQGLQKLGPSLSFFCDQDFH